MEKLTLRAKMIQLELQNMKRKNNQGDGRPSKRRKLDAEAQVLTSAEQKEDAAMRRKQKENDREQQRQDRAPDAPFMGSLSSKSKPNLQEIAGALSLSEEGTKEVLIRRINTFFDSHPLIRDSKRFTGLFDRAHRWRIDMNRDGATQTQISDNSSHISSVSQALSHFPLTANVANLPIAGPST